MARRCVMRLGNQERLLLVIVGSTVGAAMLLVSAGKGVEEGHRQWKPGSTLHFITRLLNFDHAYPTPKGVTVKWLAQGIGAAAILVIASILWYRRHNPPAGLLPDVPSALPTTPAPTKLKYWYEALTLVEAAQLALLTLVGWSFLSTVWSPWSYVALGQSALLAMGVIWAICLGRCLSRRAAVMGAVVLMVVLILTAIVGLWYYHERNPYQRLKFPVGNPLPMAACLLPGVLLAGHFAVGAFLAAFNRAAPRRSPWLMAGAAAIVAMVVLLWAIRYTGSRSALLGLAAGLWLAGSLIALWRAKSLVLGGPRQWTIIGVAVLVALAGLWGGWSYVQSKAYDVEGGRGATIRLRFYGWSYAWRLFLHSPAVGLGQGSYYLAADALARADAEKDPLAFAGDRFTHAHNEWLETLADLGAIGLALIVLGYGLTFWACQHVLARPMSPMQRWCLFGLMASMAALIAEEATDVGMRLPGLPVVWYTVLGLAWALMRIDDEPSRRTTPFPKPVLLLGVTGAFATAAAMAVWSAGNWRGALAQSRVGVWLEQRRWSDASAAAEACTRSRLSADEIAESFVTRIDCHLGIAAFYLGVLVENGGESRDAAAAMLRQQDLSMLRYQANEALHDADFLLTRVPAYLRGRVITFGHIAGPVGELMLRSLQLESRPGGELTPRQEEEVQTAKGLIRLEYERNRLSAEAAVRCVAAWPDASIDDRLDWLRTALRGGPFPEELRSTLAGLMQQPGAQEALERRMQAVRAAVAAATPDEWQDPFAPETCRLLAAAMSLLNRWRDAAALAQFAVHMYELLPMRLAYPTLMPVALAEQASYTFRADPNDPTMAIALCRRAIAEAPAIGAREQLVRPMEQALVFYYLAAGRESDAVPLIAELTGGQDEAAVMQQMGLAYAQLCEQFVAESPESRPAGFELWAERAVDLAPRYPPTQMLRAQLAFEAGRDAEVVEALRTAESLGADPAYIDQALSKAIAKRPDSKLLSDYLASRREQPATAPAPQVPRSWQGPAGPSITRPSLPED